jgi:hypothetical protein
MTAARSHVIYRSTKRRRRVHPFAHPTGADCRFAGVRATKTSDIGRAYCAIERRSFNKKQPNGNTRRRLSAHPAGERHPLTDYVSQGRSPLGGLPNPRSKDTGNHTAVVVLWGSRTSKPRAPAGSSHPLGLHRACLRAGHP